MFCPVGQGSVHARPAVRGDEVLHDVRQRPSDAVSADDRRPNSFDLRNRHEERFEVRVRRGNGQVVCGEERFPIPESGLDLPRVDPAVRIAANFHRIKRTGDEVRIADIARFLDDVLRIRLDERSRHEDDIARRLTARELRRQDRRELLLSEVLIRHRNPRRGGEVFKDRPEEFELSTGSPWTDDCDRRLGRLIWRIDVEREYRRRGFLPPRRAAQWCLRQQADCGSSRDRE